MSTILNKNKKPLLLLICFDFIKTKLERDERMKGIWVLWFHKLRQENRSENIIWQQVQEKTNDGKINFSPTLIEKQWEKKDSWLPKKIQENQVKEKRGFSNWKERVGFLSVQGNILTQFKTEATDNYKTNGAF